MNNKSHPFKFKMKRSDKKCSQSTMAVHAPCLRVLELYSGIGGTHCALKESGLPCTVAAAVDINNVANDIYRHNFPESCLLQRAIESLTVQELNKLNIDIITMSPPCQPFCRVGKQLDSTDNRTASFLHVLKLLPKLPKMPSYIMLENVKGFDTSDTREQLLQTLTDCGYRSQEFLLTPLQFGIPNSRLRYYLIAKRAPLQFHFPTQQQVWEDLPDCAAPFLTHKRLAGPCTKCCHGNTDDGRSDSMSSPCKASSVCEDVTSGYDCTVSMATGIACTFMATNEPAANTMNSDSLNKRNQGADYETSGVSTATDSPLATSGISMATSDSSSESSIGTSSVSIATSTSPPNGSHGDDIRAHGRYQEMCGCLCGYLEQKSEEYFQPYMVPEKYFKRFWVMDIVTMHTRNTCCFTKRYAHHMEGAGSVLQMNTEEVQDLSEVRGRQDYSENVHEAVRARKLRYFSPREIANLLCFPPEYGFPEGLSPIQRYRVLGNSLNVHVVAVLLRLLTLGDTIERT